MMRREFKQIVIDCSETPADTDMTANEHDLYWRNLGADSNIHHFIVTRTGEVHSAAKGWRCRRLNEPMGWDQHLNDARSPACQTISICLNGGVDMFGYPINNFTDVQMESLWKLLVELCRQAPQINRVVGMRELVAELAAQFGHEPIPLTSPSFDVQDWIMGRERAYIAQGNPVGNEAPVGFFGRVIQIIPPGANLWAIARFHETTVEELRRLNPHIDPMNLPAGKPLVIQEGSGG